MRKSPSPLNPFKGLTKRQAEILMLSASEGLAAKEIAQKLCISEMTVNTHKRNMLHKNECKNLTQLIYKYMLMLFDKNT